MIRTFLPILECLLLLAFATLTTDAHSTASSIQRCHTKEPQEHDHHASARARQYRQFRSERYQTHSMQPESESSAIVIPVCFHVPQGQTAQLTNEQLQRQLEHLNQGYSSSSCCDSNLDWCNGECSLDTGISFVLATLDANGNVNGTTDSVSDASACVTRPRNRRWTQIVFKSMLYREGPIKEALRKGDARTLNIYYVRPVTVTRSEMLGYATFPWDYASDPMMDGVVINPAAVQGGSLTEFNEGDTLVHEVGHWLGLFHTFQGGCSPGDGVDDTGTFFILRELGANRFVNSFVQSLIACLFCSNYCFLLSILSTRTQCQSRMLARRTKRHVSRRFVTGSYFQLHGLLRRRMHVRIHQRPNGYDAGQYSSLPEYNRHITFYGRLHFHRGGSLRNGPVDHWRDPCI